MTLKELEQMFNRALHLCFSRQKWIVTFPMLTLCGLLAVICRVLSLGASPWIQMSLAFLPLFLCAALLLGMGIVLVRMYHCELGGEKVEVLKTIKRSKDLFLGIVYLVVPLIFSYLILWMIFGVFYLIRVIPSVGEFVSAILSFGPFLLVLGSLALGLINLLILFYLTPPMGMGFDVRWHLGKDLITTIKANPFYALLMPLIALLPLLILVGMLSLAAVVTQILYFEAGGGFFIALKWLFIMPFFSFILSPVVVFFFNFAAEAYTLSHQKNKNL